MYAMKHDTVFNDNNLLTSGEVLAEWDYGISTLE
jgi:hypothetical protein